MTSRPLPYLAGVLALAAVYFYAAKLGLSLATIAPQVTIVWPPTGIALAALLLFGYRWWPGVALGAFLANATTPETPLPVALGIAVGNTLEALLGAWLLRRLPGFRNSLGRVIDVLGLVALAACVSTTASATIGVTSLCLGGVRPWADFGPLWGTWWLGDAMGDVVMAPALLAWAGGPRLRWRPGKAAEATAVLLGLAGVSAAVFWADGSRAVPGYPLEYTTFPFVVWAALRFGQRGASTATLTALAVAIMGTVANRGPFAGDLAPLHLYMAVVAVTALLLGATVTERRTAERRQAMGYAVTAVLAESPALADAAPRLLRVLCDCLGWDTGAVWSVDRHAGALRCVAVWRRPQLDVAEFEAATRGRTFAPGVGLPGRVWSGGRPAWIADVARDANFPRAAVAARHGLHGAFAFPVVLGKEVVGVLEFFNRRIERPDEDLLDLLAAAGGQIGLFMERKRAEEALRQSETRLRAILDNTTAVIYVKDLQGRYLLVNRRFEALFHRTREEIQGKTDHEIFPRETADAFRANDRAVLAAMQPLQWEEVAPHDDGPHTYISVKFPLLGAAGAPYAICGISTDITERKRAEETSRFLADAGAALAALVDPDAALRKVARLAAPSFAAWCFVDLAQPDGSLRRVAAAYADPSRAGLAEELGRRYPPDPAAPRGAYAVLRTGKPDLISEITDGHLAQTARDEEHLRVLRSLGLKSYLCVPLWGRGQTVGVVSFFAAGSGRRYDAADLAVAEELARRASIALENAQLYDAVREAAHRKDEFLALLAHELRNPLTPIRNAVHVLKAAAADAAAAGRARDLIERQVEHLVRLVDDLLDVSRMMRGKIELRKERIDLAAAVARAVETAAPAVEAGRHELTVSLPPEPLRLEADPVRLAQVIANLLNNAAKYTEPGGRITLTAAREGDEAVVRVRDTGVGVAADMLPKIFDLFVQADRSLDRAQGGMGVGLTLVRRLVELHGGGVQAYSDGPGKGSEFVVRLPAAPAAPPEENGRREDRPAADRRPPRRRILVVDDNADVAESLALMLRLDGQDVRVARDGPAALEAARAEPPEVVFLDIGMPGMDGCEAARRLRQLPGVENALLVALTGWGQEEDRRRTAEAGFDHHLVKPVEPATLHTLLQRPPRPGEGVTS
jgi:PAS domain S-box-containing protein